MARNPRCHPRGWPRVYFDGELVHDVTIHPAFRGQRNRWRGSTMSPADPANREAMTYHPRTGGPVLRFYHIPRPRRTLHTPGNEHAMGGRDLRLDGAHPDHVAGFLAGMPPSRASLPKREAYARTSCAITNITRQSPISLLRHRAAQIRALQAHTSIDLTLHAGVVGSATVDRAQGRTQLGTGAVFSDAFTSAVSTRWFQAMRPMRFRGRGAANAPGLKIDPGGPMRQAQRAHSIIPVVPVR